MPIWLLLPQLHSFRVCYLHTLVSMLSAWATNCFLFLLLCLRSCGHFVSRHILPWCGPMDWVLPILLLHHAHFAPRHILPWCGHLLCWCYWLGVTHTAAASCPLCSKTYSALVWSYGLGVTHTAAAPCPLCSKTYSALVWPLMLVLLIGCYPYCCCIMPTLLQDALPVLVFCLGHVAAVARATSWVAPIALLQLLPACFLMPYMPILWHRYFMMGSLAVAPCPLGSRIELSVYWFVPTGVVTCFAGATGWVLPWHCSCLMPARLQV